MRLQPTRPAFLGALLLTACAPKPSPPAEGLHRTAVTQLKEAGKTTQTARQRAVLYLDSARGASELLNSGESGESARFVYNKAAAGLTE